jgi:hypothetical protein
MPVLVPPSAIEKHARGGVAALARGIIEELRAAGLEIRRTDAIPRLFLWLPPCRTRVIEIWFQVWGMQASAT